MFVLHWLGRIQDGLMPIEKHYHFLELAIRYSCHYLLAFSDAWTWLDSTLLMAHSSWGILSFSQQSLSSDTKVIKL
jgi:hypothetical protein